jgi:hypothetical protein
MRFTPDNFLYMLKQLVCGANVATDSASGSAKAYDGGFKKEENFPLGAVSLSSGTVTFSTLVSTSGVQVLTTSDAQANLCIFSFPIPRDYDEASDVLAIRVNLKDSAADSGVTLTGAFTIQPPGGAIGTQGSAISATLPFGTAAANLSTSYQVLEIPFSGNGLKRDSVVGVELAVAGTVTGNILTTFIEYLYDSTLVSYNYSDATGTDGNLQAEGNLLR